MQGRGPQEGSPGEDTPQGRRGLAKELGRWGRGAALGRQPHPRLTCCTGSCSKSSGSQTSVSSGFLPTFWKWWDRRGSICAGRGGGAVHTPVPQDLGSRHRLLTSDPVRSALPPRPWKQFPPWPTSD